MPKAKPKTEAKAKPKPKPKAKKDGRGRKKGQTFPDGYTARLRDDSLTVTKEDLAKYEAWRGQGKYQHPHDLWLKAKEYFDLCEEKGKPPTSPGLILHCGYKSHEGFNTYAKKDEFDKVVTWCRLVIEDYNAAAIHSRNATGGIFTLKNMGWRDAQDINVTHDSLPQEIEAARKRLRLVNGGKE